MILGGKARHLLAASAITAAVVISISLMGRPKPEPTLEGRSVRDLVRQAAEYSQALSTNSYAEDVLYRNGARAVPGLVAIMAPGYRSLSGSAAHAITSRYYLCIRLPQWVQDWAQRTTREADRKESDREWAVVWCASLGTNARTAHPALIAACSDPNWRVRKEAARALVRTEVPSEVSVPILTRMLLTNEPGEVKSWAASSLGLLHWEAAAAIPALRQLTNDPRWFVSMRAREALSEIQDANPKKPNPN